MRQPRQHVARPLRLGLPSRPVGAAAAAAAPRARKRGAASRDALLAADEDDMEVTGLTLRDIVHKFRCAHVCFSELATPAPMYSI